MLSNLGSNASERSLEPPSFSSNVQLPLELRMDEDQLSSLEALGGQELELIVNNGSDDRFTEVSLTLRVSSENTALTDSRYYQAKIEDLEAGDSKPVQFLLNLSPIPNSQKESYRPETGERSRVVLEVQATTPEGISTVKTAVLPFSNGNSN